MRFDLFNGPTSQIKVFVLLVFVFSGVQRGFSSEPVAQNGALDLSQWNWEQDGITTLTGDWTFYWERFLDPQDAFSQPDLGVPIMVPGNWNHTEIEEGTVGAKSFGTYTLRLQVPASGPILALKIPPIRSAYRLWCNGNEVATSGKLAAEPADYFPSYNPKIIALPGNTTQFDLVLQVSNFHHRYGGVGFPISIGTHAQIVHRNNQGNLYEIFLLATLFVMALYHFGLYLIRRKELSALAFALYCVFSFLRVPLEGQYIFYQLFPETNLSFWLRFDYLTFLGVGFGFCLFLFKMFPGEWNRMVGRSILGFILLTAMAVIFLPLVAAGYYIPITQGVFALGGFYCIFVLIMAIRRKREGAVMLLIALLVFFSFYINDILYYSSSWNTGVLTTSGALFFIFIQAFLLSSRYSNAFSLSEIYARTFQKFVPRQFLDRIAKNGISSIELGNAAPENAVVLFSDIRGFTALSEQLSPDEVFLFLNEYLSRMEPSIRENDGFVDKYLGDAIMALFTQEDSRSCADNAIRAALGMKSALKKFNKERKGVGVAPVEIGIGLHFGKVIIGTVGGGERMDSTAIGDTVNVASRVEGASKIYRVPLVVTEDVVDTLPEGHGYRLRFLDRVRVMGREQPIGLFEVRGTSQEPNHAVDLAWIALFEKASQDYFAGKFADAKAEFKAFLELVPNDGPAQLYLERCEDQWEETSDANWTGVTNLETK